MGHWLMARTNCNKAIKPKTTPETIIYFTILVLLNRPLPVLLICNPTINEAICAAGNLNDTVPAFLFGLVQPLVDLIDECHRRIFMGWNDRAYTKT
jgi:hypothetical protein